MVWGAMSVGSAPPRHCLTVVRLYVPARFETGPVGEELSWQAKAATTIRPRNGNADPSDARQTRRPLTKRLMTSPVQSVSKLLLYEGNGCARAVGAGTAATRIHLTDYVRALYWNWILSWGKAPARPPIFEMSALAHTVRKSARLGRAMFEVRLRAGGEPAFRKTRRGGRRWEAAANCPVLHQRSDRTEKQS